MGGFFSKPKAPNTAKAIERPGKALMKDMPEYTQAAKLATKESLAAIEKALPGATAYRAEAIPRLAEMGKFIGEQQQVISDLIGGKLPKATEQQILRRLAEVGGAGFSMQAAGQGPFIQSPQAMLAENIRQTSEQRMLQGLALAPGITEQRGRVEQIGQSWQALAESFTYDPFEASQFAGPSQRYGETRARAMAQDFALQQEANEMFYNRMLGAAKFATNIIGGSRLGGGDQGGGGGGGGGGQGGVDFLSAAAKVFGGK